MTNVAQDVLWPTDSNVLIRVGMLYVGQGDASVILVKDGLTYKTILIDINQDAEGCNGINVPKLMKDLLTDQDGRLDLFVNTHPHNDHLDDITELSESFDIHEVWESGHVPGEDDKASYDELQKVIKKVKREYGKDAVREMRGSDNYTSTSEMRNQRPSVFWHGELRREIRKTLVALIPYRSAQSGSTDTSSPAPTPSVGATGRVLGSHSLEFQTDAQHRVA